MLESITDLVKEHAGDLLGNSGIPADKKTEVAEDASSSIVSGLKSAVAGGNFDGLMGLFNGGANAASANPVTHNIQAGFIQNLTQKYGLDQGKASGIASAIIPLVIQKLVHRTNDPNDKKFDLQDIIGNLTGGAGIGDIVKNFTGGGSSEEGGLLGKIKGMF